MRFEPQKNGKLKVTLAPRDMASLGITYEQMDYSDPQTRSILTRLLEAARKRSGFSCPDNARLLIELFPTLEGGCSILFTVLEQRAKVNPTAQAEQTFAFAFPSLDPLGQAAAKLERQNSLPDSYGCRCSLYRLGEEYRLLCQLRHPADPDQQREHPCLRELLRRGRQAGRGALAAAYCDEHGELIISQYALKQLAQCWK